MINKYYNYIYLDPRKPGKYFYIGLDYIFKYEPFYAGKGSGKRIKSHFWSSSLKIKTFKSSMIKTILSLNLKPIIIKLNDNISETEAFENEKFLIKKIGRKDLNLGPLCNHTDGGEGNFKRIKSIEEINKWKKSFGKRNLTEEHKRNIGLGNKGKISKITIEARKQKHKLYGSPLNKKVLQLDLNNNIIREFKSLTETCNILGLKRTSAGERCRTNNLKPINNFKLIYSDNKT